MTQKDWAPSSCSLPTEQRPLRAAEFDELFRTMHGYHRVSATRAVLRLAGDASTAAQARSLAARETECCSFFEFDVREVGPDVVVTISVPPARAPVLDGLVSQAQRAAT